MTHCMTSKPYDSSYNAIGDNESGIRQPFPYRRDRLSVIR
jgi:hypothetical protein